MKKILSIIFGLVVMTYAFSAVSIAKEVKKITLDQKSTFKSVATLVKNDFAVPVMIDVPLSFNKNTLLTSVVVGEDGAMVPSKVVGKTKK